MGVAIRSLLDGCIENPGWENILGTAAIDAYNALYQFLTGIRQPNGDPLMDNEGRITSHLNGLLFRSANLIEKNITPIYIFDGKPPEFKRKTLDERNKIREHAKEEWTKAKEEGDDITAYKHAMASTKVDTYIINTSKELLTALGIPWIQAPGEGEAQASFMTQNGDATFAVSQDYDSLLFGCETLVRNITISGKRKVHGKIISLYPERISLRNVLPALDITREELIQIALLVGTDYNSGVMGIGPKKAIKIVKNGNFEDKIAESENSAEPKVLINYFLHPDITTEYSIKKTEINRDDVYDLLCNRHGFSYERIEAGLDKIDTKKCQTTLGSWF